MRQYEANKIRAIVDALERGTMSRPVAIEKLREMTVRRPKLPMMPIVQWVAQWHMLPVEELLGTSRKRCVSEARQVAMFYCRRYANATNTEIARLFNRDQTTVSYGIMRTRNDITSPELKKIEADYALRPLTKVIS